MEYIIEMLKSLVEILKPWFELWGSAIGWTLIGIALVKCIKYPYGVAFSLRTWINENIIDVMIGILITLIVVKLGDGLFSIIATFFPQVKEITETLHKVDLDPIQLALVIAMVVQFKYVEKWRPRTQIKSKD